MNMGKVRKHIRFTGRVQGVGFRYRAAYAARSLGVTGWVTNLDDGSVEMEAQGTEEQIQRILAMLNGDSYIVIEKMEINELPTKFIEKGFHVKGY